MPSARDRLTVIARRAWVVSGVAMVAAGLLKLADLEAFVSTLSGWRVLPPTTHLPLAVSVPVLELGLGLAALVGLWRTRALLALTCLLTLLTSVFVVESIVSSPPDCGCFGLISKWHDAHPSVWWVLARNVLLIVMLVPGLLHEGAETDTRRMPRTPSHAAASRGFSIVELLVVIAVIGVLVALALPMLGRSMKEARGTASLANLKSHATIVTLYSTDSADTFPWFTDTSTWNLDLEYADRDYSYPHFFLAHVWGVGLVDYYDGIWPHAALAHPGVREECSYYLSSTLMASPEFWDGLARTGPEQWKPQMLHNVTFPGKKAMFVTAIESQFLWWSSKAPTVEFALVDGSAARFPAARLIEPLLTGDGRWYGTYLPLGAFGMHTVRGIHGRDVQ